MKVKDVIISALNILGRRELAADLSEGSALDAEGTDTVNTLLYCFNAVEDEVARRYVPLSYKEDLRSFDCKFLYREFTHTPAKIKKVTVDGQEADFEVFPLYIWVNAKVITVEYEFAPSKKTITGDSDFEADVSEYLLALGAAAEYCLINGEVEAAEIWERKYRGEIDCVQRRLPTCASIPPRRWV